MKPDLIQQELIWKWAQDLFPLNRSLISKETLKTLQYINAIFPDMHVVEVPTGAQIFDWKVPKEWELKRGYIKDMNGEIIIDSNKLSLSVMTGSAPVNCIISRQDLLSHIHSLPEQPQSVPYVTSYYKEDWGFCMTHESFIGLQDSHYNVLIDSNFNDSHLLYGEIVIPSTVSCENSEVFFSACICHPSLANNELSGPLVAMNLIKWIKEQAIRKYNYRFVFVPETIGSLAFLSKNHEHLKEKIIAGYNLSCLGDSGNFSCIPTRLGNTFADFLTQNLLRHNKKSFNKYAWRDRGGDERQYCSPLIDLPVVTITRSKFGSYPEYHTDQDNLSYISAENLMESVEFFKLVFNAVEKNEVIIATFIGEPMLSKRNLYPTLSIKTLYSQNILLDVSSYADGNHSLLEIADLLEISILQVIDCCEVLKQFDIVKSTGKTATEYKLK